MMIVIQVVKMSNLKEKLREKMNILEKVTKYYRLNQMLIIWKHLMKKMTNYCHIWFNKIFL